MDGTDEARTKAGSSEDALTLADTADTNSEDSSEETASLAKSVVTKKSKGSRVSVKTPGKLNSVSLVQEAEDVQIVIFSYFWK